MAQSVSWGILFSVFIYIVKDIISDDTSCLFLYRFYLSLNGSYIAEISAFYTTNLFHLWMFLFVRGSGGGADEGE